MQRQLSRVGVFLLLTAVVFSSLGVIAVDDTKTLDGQVQFESEMTGETVVPNSTTTVEQALESTIAGTEADTVRSQPFLDTLSDEDNRDCSPSAQTKDSDDDYVNDFLECEHGLDETSADTDGDALTDAEELLGVTETGTPIPDSNPRHKDIYLIIGLSQGAHIDAGELASLFSTFNIGNPDGQTGITLHYQTYQLNQTARVGNFDESQDTYGAKLTGETQVYRGLLVTSGWNDWYLGEYLGRADVDDNFAAAQHGKEKVAAHEILHLVVGKIPENNCKDPYHNCHGQTILNPSVTDAGHNRLSYNTTVHIEKTGLDPQRPRNSS